jgi:hypothetical protein
VTRGHVLSSLFLALFNGLLDSGRARKLGIMLMKGEKTEKVNEQLTKE